MKWLCFTVLLTAFGCGAAAALDHQTFPADAGDLSPSGNGSGTTRGAGAASGSAAAAGTTGGAGSQTGGSGNVGAAAAASSTSGATALASTALNGDLAFPVAFVGEFYAQLPDGGADLSSLDCRIADGTDLWSQCAEQRTHDGGPADSARILDIYVTSNLGFSLTAGDAPVDPSSVLGIDAGIFATLELTLRSPDGGRQVLFADQGDVTYQATADGVSGVFDATFGLPDGGLSSMTGSFGAAYCNSLNGYP